MTCFPQYKLEDFERMTHDTYVYLIALAELACHHIRGIPIKIFPGELEAQIQAIQQAQVNPDAGEPLR